MLKPLKGVTPSKAPQRLSLSPSKEIKCLKH